MCVRAVVPRLHVFSWRQFIVAIVKTKFASDAICFDPDDFNGDGEEIEADIKVMTEQRNHKIWTVNRANANQALSNSTFANVYDGLIQKGLPLARILASEIVAANKKGNILASRRQALRIQSLAAVTGHVSP
ncbi:hypothetical protein LTR91_025122 [Friedmanniomyces endolithicus]|uniref:Uncharacterized protein n=1 Tax=Friedmanniomyces endolithicus TaxID=329885 RepID=A0AAN6JZQ9_9PEZI|nr:hypothetical protein LTR91_025122 [Friedmanniomyces endolithicus]KAK1021418.1 hypothetical protein LTS16_026519 [Friedmanniomyces endolithicus]